MIKFISLGTLTRNKSEYRTPPVVAPPQVPSNYAPNYPKTSRGGQQYGTLPHQHPQVGMVYPQPQEGGATMPRLSSHSMRSTHSANSGTPTPPPHEGTYGVTRKVIKSFTLVTLGGIMFLDFFLILKGLKAYF